MNFRSAERADPAIRGLHDELQWKVRKADLQHMRMLLHALESYEPRVGAMVLW